MAAGQTEAEAAARAALLDVESYSVVLDFAAGPQRIRSSTELRFRCREPGATTYADLSAPTVLRAVCNGRRLDPQAARDSGRLWLPGLAGRNLVTVEAEVPVPPDGQALSLFTDPADGAVYLHAQCFPTYASSVFCCFDQPDLRADLAVAVSAPAGWVCVGNGTVAGRPAAGRAGTWRFATMPGLKPYELTLCAGPYATAAEEEYRGQGGPVSLSVRCRRTLAASAGLGRVAGLVRRSLDYYERLLGVPCPYRKYDLVFVPGLEPLATSLPGVMAINEIMLRRAADPGDDFVALVLAHEVAHLWFGCLVEGRWWDDLWLAEALATYLSYTAGEEALGLTAPWAEFAMREQAAAYRADGLPSTQPVSSPVATAADALVRPAAITYNKGASVIRQLAALIGDDALRAGLRAYLTRHGGASATLDDLVGCWSAASGRDLTRWAGQWLRTPGVNTLGAELALAKDGPKDGTVAGLAVTQQPSSPADQPGQPGVLRAHRVTVGAYVRSGGGLRRRAAAEMEISGARRDLPELTGTPAPDAVIVNDGNRTFARIRFDDRSWRALAGCAMQVGDPLTEAVCWNAAWDLVTAAELSAAEFAGLVARRVAAAAGRATAPPPGLAELLERAVTGADYYAAPQQRPALRERVAAAALDGARLAPPGRPAQRALAAGFAASAHSDDQLDQLRAWLGGRSLPAGLPLDDDLRARMLATLAARGLAGDDDLAALAADPVTGQAHLATCRALRPEPAAKQAAWSAALDGGQPARLAQAHARGIWAPGQETLLAPYVDRYFTEALAVLRGRERRAAQQLARLLYPVTLADPATIAATDAALRRCGPGDALRPVLAEQRVIVQQMMTARARTGGT